jgi:hypothetical protein
MMKALVLVVLACAVSASACGAGEMNFAPANNAIVRVDWQAPEQLPPRFRNHCALENFTSRPYCSNHCGIDYQFYYCSEASFGCCHLGHGYCDWNGVLRCHP